MKASSLDHSFAKQILAQFAVSLSLSFAFPVSPDIEILDSSLDIADVALDVARKGLRR